MVRPCFLVVDQEYAGSISTRKLVIETAKLNVITAYSSVEAIETLAKYPAVNGVVLDARMPDMACDELVGKLKALQPNTPVIVVGGPGQWECEKDEHYLKTFEPKRRLDLIEKIEPEQTKAIEEHNEELALATH